MNLLVGLVLGGASVLVALPVTMFALEVLAGVAARNRPARPASKATRRGSVAVLIPAHNESAGLRPTLDDLKAQLGSGDRLIVIADNCSDDTAAQARAAGAEVVERHEPERRGKDYALDFGLQYLTRNPPETVIVIDADCRVGRDAVGILADACATTGRPAQALDLMNAPANAASSMGFAVFAWRVKNWVRPLGLRALGLPCQLMGTGMGFPWPVIAPMRLGGGDIVEDLKLGLQLARGRKPAQFCPTAVVTSEFPSTAAGAETQRRRWESGHLRTIARDAPLLIAQGIADRNWGLLVLALDMAIPPLTFLAFACLAVALITGGALALGFSTMPFALSLASLALLFLATGLAWLGFGRDVLPLRRIPAAGAFLVNKLRLYGSIVRRRGSREWIRTDRGSGRDGPAD